MDLARELLLDHERRPRHAAPLARCDVEVQHLNPACGDRVTLRLTLDGAVVRAVSHEALGCTVSRASASMMCELLPGRSLEHGREAGAALVALLRRGAADDADDAVLGDAVALAGVGRYPTRVRCALLPWEALSDAGAHASREGRPPPS